MPDGGFDPVAEIRRLRQDLMLRLQHLQQLVALESEQNAETIEEPQDPPEVLSKSETILYVSSAVAAEETTQVLMTLLPSRTESETVADAPLNPVATAKESSFIQILRWVNAVLVVVGVVGAVVGIGNFVLPQHLTNPKELAIILLVAGMAMVLVGIVGRLTHQYGPGMAPSGTQCPALCDA